MISADMSFGAHLNGFGAYCSAGSAALKTARQEQFPGAQAFADASEPQMLMEQTTDAEQMYLSDLSSQNIAS